MAGITGYTQDHRAKRRTAAGMKKAIKRNPNPARRKKAATRATKKTRTSPGRRMQGY